jgi:hypothetical protein
MARFDWGYLPGRLARHLADDLAATAGPDTDLGARDALGRRFGSPPGEDFVRIAWPVLVDRWLGTDPDARDDVVAQLRAAGLGDRTRTPRTKAEQLAYLRTCRNTTRLRQTVLDRFLEAGQDRGVQVTGGTPPSGPAGEYGTAALADASANATLLDDPATTDLSAKVQHAWAELARSLAAALRALPVGGYLRLTLDPTAGGTGDATYYLEFVAPDAGVLHAEAVGNAALPPDHRLDRTAVAELVALGWQPPGVIEGTGPNFGLRVNEPDAGRLAALSVRTLREVYGAPHPAFLTYAVHTLDEDVEVPSIVGPRPAESISTELTPVADPDAPLLDQVRAVVGEVLETSPSELTMDDDGDIGIRSGSAMVFVRVHDDPSLVDVYSPVLTDVTPSERLYERLSALTRSMPIGRLYVADDTVWASVAVFGRDFQASHLRLAIKLMTGLADALDDRLQGDFGGRRFFDTSASRPAVEGGDTRTGMYL